jgi:putative protease
MGDTSLNAFNCFSASELQKLGLSGTALSYELTLNQISSMLKPSEFELEAVVYGSIPLMTSEYCPVGSAAGSFKAGTACKNACVKSSYRLKDRKGMEFPIICDKVDCRSTVMNSNVLFLIDSIEKFRSAGIDSVRLNITDEDGDMTREIVKMHFEALKGNVGSLERYRGITERIKSAGFTKGHYFRGV